MKTLLLVSKNMSFVKKIYNSINKEKILVINLCTSYKEMKKMINMLKPELILIELDFNINQIFELNELSFINVEYNPTIILKLNINLSRYILKGNLIICKTDIDIIEYLKKLNTTDLNEDNFEFKIENTILKEMTKMGFEMKNQGDLFLLETIKYMKINEEFKNNLNKDIYPEISKKLNIPIDRIKWNIIYSINCVYRYKTDYMKKYLNTVNREKPTPKLIICSILKKI